MDAGRLDSRVKFQRQIPGADDGYGNTLPASWSDVVTVWASFRPQFGSEKVEAGVLESTLRGVLMVRRSTATEGVTPAYRAVFVSGHFTGKECQIRSISPTMDGAGLEMTIEEGLAT